MIVTRDGAMPAAELGLGYGLHDALDVELSAGAGFGRQPRAAALGVVEPRLVFRPAGHRAPGAMFALTLGPELFWGTKGDGYAEGDGFALLGVSPGLRVSVGGRRLQATYGLDVPIFPADGIGAISSDGFFVVRQTLGLEAALGKTTSFYLRGGPTLSVGFGGKFEFASLAAGVAF